MQCRKVDVTVVSAENVKEASSFVQIRTYAVVWFEQRNRMKTRVDEHGNTNPSWNECLSFSVPESILDDPASSLNIEIYRTRSVLGHKVINMASIPVSELLKKPDGKQTLMYELIRRSGKTKGAVRFSVRVGEKTTIPAH
ncbi:hypothetical protein KP509_11G051600 [Ceratopteris richardii]|uniref:C2 domain-containing protein n=1 Tax=Ceratopteris richardii TaxID=49495 RepID=A0A8T2TVH4_CERRI|nr:hypothetical protein KP509_11G051600 [Ceratopteris richardii]